MEEIITVYRNYSNLGYRINYDFSPDSSFVHPDILKCKLPEGFHKYETLMGTEEVFRDGDKFSCMVGGHGDVPVLYFGKNEEIELEILETI